MNGQPLKSRNQGLTSWKVLHLTRWFLVFVILVLVLSFCWRELAGRPFPESVLSFIRGIIPKLYINKRTDKKNLYTNHFPNFSFPREDEEEEEEDCAARHVTCEGANMGHHGIDLSSVSEDKLHILKLIRSKTFCLTTRRPELVDTVQSYNLASSHVPTNK